MLKVYCDTGAHRPELSELERNGSIRVYQFKYENKNRKIRRQALPSRPTWSETNYTWNELKGLSWGDMGKQTEHWRAIESLIGKDNEVDAKHLDSAYGEGCQVFLTSDKGDICSHRRALEQLLGIKVLHYREDWNEFLSLLPAAG